MAEKKAEIAKSTNQTQGRNLRERPVESSVIHRKDVTLQRVTNPSVEQIIGKANMKSAYERVVNNKGAPGIDNIGVESLKSHLFRNWPIIRDAILNGTYKSDPVKRVSIPKPGGGSRNLGIPTTTDRCIQQALHQALAPLFEPDFSDYSYGFIKGRSAHDAILQAREFQEQGYRWVVDLDLEKFFDNVDHDILMSRIQRKVEDKRVLRLIRAFLNAEVSDQGKIYKPGVGTPQGGPLSPLLSNIILDDLDRELERRGHRFVRYADDCSIFVKSEKAGIRVLASISRYLERKLKLKVNMDKSKVDKPHKRKLLGYSFIPSKTPMIKVAPEAIRKLKTHLKPIFRRGRGKNLESFIKKDLNPVLRGWANYFSLASGKKTFVNLDMWVRRKIRNLLWRRWRSFESRYRVFSALLPREEAKLAAKSGRGAWFNSGTKLVNAAFNLDFFDKHGLVCTLNIWKSNEGYRRTALVRNRMPGGVGGR